VNNNDGKCRRKLSQPTRERKKGKRFAMKYLTIPALVLSLLIGAVPALSWAAAGSKHVTLYKDPGCMCCEGYANYLRTNGFDVTVVGTHDLPLMNAKHHIPAELQGCHLSEVDGYFVGGHVPVDVVNRLLSERPSIDGITLPGMPPGSPGMFGDKAAPFVIYGIAGGKSQVYATE